MMKHLLLFFAIFFAACCNNQKEKDSKKKSQLEQCSEYPTEVDSLHVRDLYDSARWYIYTYSCDRICNCINDSLKDVSLGELQLKFNNLKLMHDTLEINYDFICNDDPLLPRDMKLNQPLLTGIGFDIKERKKIYMGSPSGFSIKIKGEKSRFETPLQPAVLDYLEEHRSSLNECFRILAEKKGVLK
jgi:hypothetical protein